MKEIWNEACIYSPSLICLDMCNLEEQTRLLEQGGIQMLHVDILDGHFSPSMPLGLETVRQLRKKTDMEFDAHVMVREPEYFIDELLDIGVQQLIFHAETADHIDGYLNRIHAHGARAGVALKPSTPLNTLEYVLEKCDTVLLMLMNPGYASSAEEKQVPYADKKIRALRSMIQKAGLPVKIEIDGRVSTQNIEQYGGSDVDIFVVGSTCMNRDKLSESLDRLRAMRERIVG